MVRAVRSNHCSRSCQTGSNPSWSHTQPSGRALTSWFPSPAKGSPTPGRSPCSVSPFPDRSHSCSRLAHRPSLYGTVSLCAFLSPPSLSVFCTPLLIPRLLSFPCACCLPLARTSVSLHDPSLSSPCLLMRYPRLLTSPPSSAFAPL